MKLPKQWKRWCEKSGLKNGGRDYDCFSLYGRNRQWRVNMFGDFQCSCPTKYFDRWANSLGAQMDGIPKTEAEFIKSVDALVDQSRDSR